ncbi:MAG: filamentous hemagglutinin N-terminal domain-containing protein, partial [Calothrix sp. C42_A2020_038]|nr:filamentous hemagglutinin N-terminal domain-containing protein [Calothrix sp. C42_A2020_038]
MHISHRAKLRKIKNKVKTKVKSKAKVLLVWLVLFLSFGPHQVLAQVITPANDGTGTIVNTNGSNPNQFNITGGTQSGANLFHSFQKFGLNSGQIANFLSTPNIQNILGRVVGGDASYINGLIQVSSGASNLYLMNPAGIVFGQNASLNVPAAFNATTANGIGFGNNLWFNAVGNNNYTQLNGNPSSFAFTSNQLGSIVNAGNLAVNEGQSLTLLGGTVVNTGKISAPGGNITITAVPGEKLVRVSSEGSLLSLDLPVETKTAVNTPNTPLSLPQLLTGGDAIGATGMTVENGAVMLTSSGTSIPAEQGTNIVSGQVSAPAGKINILGEKVGLIAANINASGSNGGGTVLVGGDYQGKGTVPNAKDTVVSSDTVINADAVNNGNGGKVIVWADNNTKFAGSITARGGANGGNGGLVETSGKKTLDVTGGKVNASAVNGQAGTWLLDPTDIDIVNGGTGNNISPATIENTLDGGTNVEIQTASGSGGFGDIYLKDSINQTGGGNASLTLTGRMFFQPNGATINMNSTGGLNFNLNQVNPETNPNTSSINNAINAIGNVAGSRIINLGAGTYEGGTVNVNKNVTINGVGAGSTVLSGNNANQVFNVASGVTATLQNLTITKGQSTSSSGINNSGNLTVGNSAITGNYTLGYGGAINNNSNATFTLLNSTVSGNTAEGGGGAITNGGTFTLSNSTISGNTAKGDGGGGFYNIGNLTVENSTITDNITTGIRQGNGIFNAGNLTLNNSIVAQNRNANPDIFIFSGSINPSSSYNIIGNASGMTGISNGANGNQVGVNPLLGPLANNGGATQTHALLAGSPAIDAGDPDSTISTDQRGGQRGANGINSGSRIDIGAYEATSSYLVTNTTDNNNMGSLRAAVNFANQNVNSTQSIPTTTIRFDNTGAFFNPAIITLAGSPLTFTSGNTTVDGTGINHLTISGRNASQVFNIGSGATVTLQYLKVTEGNSLNGGGINNNGNLTLNHTIISNNLAQNLGNGGGGGIFNTGTLTVNSSTINDNTSQHDGGGILNTGTLMVNNSTINDNDALNFGGGGIINFGILDVNNSTISGNTANNSGGGIYNFNFLRVSNSTISDNTTYNQEGGGIRHFSGYFILNNSIVAKNYGANPDISGFVNESKYNLIGDGTGMSGINNGVNGNQVGTAANPINPLLTNLGNYGGATQTMALLPGSPAINTGDPSVTTDDQRGFNRVGETDIGAFESGGFTITGNNQSNVVNTSYPVTVTVTANTPGEPVAGGVVNYSVSTGTTGATATLGTNTATIDVSGQASVTATANTVAGSYTVSVDSNDGTAPTDLTLTNIPDVPASITSTGGNNQTTTVNTNFANNLQALVKDQYGNVIPGATITFTAPSSGASATTSSTLTTDSKGEISIGVKANTIAGGYQVSLGVGNGVIPVSFNLTNTPDASANITVTGGNNQSTTVDTNFANNLQAVVKDQYGNIVPGASITFTAPNSGASATTTANTVTADTNGQVSIPVRANAVAGSYTVTLGSGSANVNFNLTNNSIPTEPVTPPTNPVTPPTNPVTPPTNP